MNESEGLPICALAITLSVSYVCKVVFSCILL